MGKRATAFRYAFIVALGGFIFGLDAALISGTVRFVTVEFGLSDLQVGAVVSAPGFGVIFALLVTGHIAARLGRRKALLIIASLYLVSAIASVLAPNFEALVAARFLGGLAFTSLSLASMYIGEIAPSEMRGKLVSMNQINIVIGLSAAYFANNVILQASASGAEWVQTVGIVDYTWRWMLGIEILPALLWLLLLLQIPESPRWLVQTGDVQSARNVLERLLPAGRVEPAIIEIQASAEHGHAQKSVGAQLADLFHPRMRTALWLGLTIAIVQPITGINSILFYAPTVFEQTGIGTDAAFAQAVVVGLVSVVFTVLALLLIDKVGRRPMTLLGLTWAGLSLAACAWLFSTATYVLDDKVAPNLSANVSLEDLRPVMGAEFDSDVAFKAAVRDAIGDGELRANESVLLQNAAQLNSTAILVAIVSFIAAFNFSIGPIMWVLFSEIFPIYVRSIAIPSFALVTSVVNYFVNQFFPWQLNNMGAAEIFSFYGGCVFAGLLILSRILPETKNKTIEQIERELSGVRGLAA
ncbi:MAG: MFS transporter [Pseudomonadota bacterium]